MNFSNNLRNLRDQQDVTQEQLADYLQVSRATIAGYETKHHQPDYEKLEKIAQFFGVSIDFLITGTQAEVKGLPNESALDCEVLLTYRSLALQSKKDALKYLQLLQLRDEKMQK